MRPLRRQPLTHKELLKLGAFWLRDQAPQMGFKLNPGRSTPKDGAGLSTPTDTPPRSIRRGKPEDLMFHETPDKRNFQGRYVLRHPWKGDAQCPAADHYRERLAKSQEKRAQTLANLTGWKIEDIQRRWGSPRLRPKRPALVGQHLSLNRPSRTDAPSPRPRDPKLIGHRQRLRQVIPKVL